MVKCCITKLTESICCPKCSTEIYSVLHQTGNNDVKDRLKTLEKEKYKEAMTRLDTIKILGGC